MSRRLRLLEKKIGGNNISGNSNGLDKIVSAAVEIVEETGFENLTLTAVAKLLGVRQPALYRQVKSRQEVLRAVSLRGREMLAAELTDAGIGLSGEDAVRALGHAWRRFVQVHPKLYFAIDAYPCAGDSELEDAVERVVSVIELALRGFGLSDEQEIHAARALRSAWHGFSDIEARQGHPMPHNLDDTFEHMLDFLCAGVKQ